MENPKKCFSEEHKEIDAVTFCPQCRIYMCNKCTNYHLPFFKNHHPFNLNKEDEIFTGFCKEKNHPNKLEYFCKTHNQLCCAACIAKINKIGDGQHKDCEVCIIQDILEEKKIKLKENIKCLEDLENKFIKDINQIKEIFKKIENDKEDMKLKIQNIFTKIRTTLNEREDELLLGIDNLFNTKYFNEEIIKKGGKLPKQIKISLEKGKMLEKEWENKNIYSNINNCINIENNIKSINILNENINKYESNNKKNFEFHIHESSVNNFLETIKSFGKIRFTFKYSFKECPINIRDDKKYTVTGEGKNILTKIGKTGSMGTICENELDSSIEEHIWKIKILKTKRCDINVGVAPIDFDINSSQHYESCGWYLYCYDSTLYSGPPFKYSGLSKKYNKVKDEIILVMNMKKRTLKFIINNEDKGDSYTDIPLDKPIVPAVLLYDKDDSVEICECG